MDKKEGMLTIPNIVTFLRFLAGPVCFYLIFIEQINWALFAFILAVLSDKLDGIIAREKRIESSFGETLDPIADNIMIIFIAAAFILKNIIEFYFLKYIVSILLIFLLAFIINSIKLGKINVPKIVFGRINTILLYVLILYIFLGFPAKELLIKITLIYGFIVGLIYLYHSIKVKRK
jgi:cardiolipin synthase